MRLTCLGAAIPLLLSAQTTVWRLGAFDHSAHEFQGREGKDVPVVDVNSPDAAKLWPASQAGSLNAHAGSKPHPREIHFRLDSAPQGIYTLDMSIMLGNPRVPRLEIEVNGTPGSVFLHRQLSYHAEGRMDSPINGEAREAIPIPAAVFRQGENTLRITAIDDVADENGDSEITWDALQLLSSSAFAGIAMPELKVEPTYFYTGPSGSLNEVVEVDVRVPSLAHEIKLALHVNGVDFPATLVGGRFGDQRFEFAVPEFGPGTQAQVTLDGQAVRAPFVLQPKRKFTVFTVPHNHLDIGFTDYQPKIEELQNRNFDKLLAEMRADPDMRFSPDGVWLVEQFLRTRNADARKEFLAHVADGRISIPAQYANLMAGGAGLETLIRSTYAGHAMNHENGRNADYANITDVPAYPWAYASVLHAAGVKYFVAGANDDRGPQPLYGRWQTRSPFWWEGPDGGKVLMAYSRQYSALWFVCGLPARETGCRESLPTLFQTYDQSLPDTILMYGSQLENTDLVPGEGEFVRRWNAKYTWPHIQIATFRDYFERIDRQYGSQLKTVRGDFGPYWEDGIGTDAKVAAEYRATESRAAAVETLSTLASLQNPTWLAPADRMKRLWQDLILYAEHTYTSWGGYSRPESEETTRQIETKHFDVVDAREETHWVAQESMSRLLDRIKTGAPAIVVFNSLAHERGGLVEYDLSGGQQIVDAISKQPVPLQYISNHDGYSRVRFLAEHVPELGYRVYLLQDGAPSGMKATKQLKPGLKTEVLFGNQFYRVSVDSARGAVTSVIDNQLGRELVDTKSPYLLNQYLYVSGGENTRIVYMRDTLPNAKLDVEPAESAVTPVIDTLPWGSEMRYSMSGPHASRIDVTIRLFNDEKKIEFVNHVTKDPVEAKEAIYFAFPFAAASPTFEYEGQAGTVQPARDELAGGNREWYTVGHWASVSSSGASAAVIPLDGPLMTFGDINRGLWPEKFEPRSSTLFGYALNNYWHTNFPKVQSGEFTFRYVVTSSAELNAAALSRLGRESLTPLEVGELTHNDKVDETRGSLPATASGFLDVAGNGFEIETLKAAEDGNGSVIRLLETAGRGGTARISSKLLQIEKAWLCNAAEDNQSEIALADNAIEVALKPYSIVTVRVVMRPAR
jgi:hypothetical protein